MRQRTPPWEIIFFWSHLTSVFQGLSLSLRRAGRREPWERVWRWHGAMGRHHRWSFPYALRGWIYSSFSWPFRSVFSPALIHVYIPFFWHGVPLPRTYKILNGSATAGFDPLYCSFGTLRLCWLRYEKEPRSSPSPWYRRQGYYTLVSPFRPTPRQQNIPRLFHLSLTTLSRYWPIPLQWS